MDDNKAWGTLTKAGFRFLFTYLLLVIFPFPLSQLPYIRVIANVYETLLDSFSLKAANKLLGISCELQARQSGSGDTAIDYGFLLLAVILSVVVTIVWSVIDTQKYNYNKLYKLLYVYVRYFVAAVLLEYGIAKIFHYQFPPLTIWQYSEPLGNSSPMGLLWKFMGHSGGYNWFTGLVEIGTGLLLLFRRTTLAGACLALVVMVQVVALNFFYDVPVKLFSVHLLLLCLFLIAPHGQRLYHFFVAGIAVEPVSYRPYTTDKNRLLLLYLAKYSFIAIVVGYNIYHTARLVNIESKVPPLYGLYGVESFVINHDTLPPLTANAARWNKFSIQLHGYASYTNAAGVEKYLKFKPDSSGNIAITNFGGEAQVWKYTLTDSNRLHIAGPLEYDTISVWLRKKLPSDYPLTQRGFNWLSNKPVNN
jgi:uncharacterized membrane protein YphA (DoxX/SURF4 family)